MKRGEKEFRKGFFFFEKILKCVLLTSEGNSKLYYYDKRNQGYCRYENHTDSVWLRVFENVGNLEMII